MNRKELAKQYFYDGYACYQAIVLAFSDLLNMDKEQLIKVSLPFGGGIGRLRLTCGAFSGMLIVVSLLFSNYEDVEENKIKTYEIVQELAKRFEEVHTTLSCEKILELAQIDIQIGGSPEARTDEYYRKRPCGKIVYQAAEILEKYLIEKNIISE
jgi:C_GCAxxG_C_C family probable redox protein